MVQRYLVFAGDQYYPSGGWNDFKGSYLTQEDAWDALVQLFATSGCDWCHVVDAVSGKVVYLV